MRCRGTDAAALLLGLGNSHFGERRTAIQSDVVSQRIGLAVDPVACLPQAWASATPFTLLEASLGLEFDPFNGEIRLRNPRLPAFLDEVILRNLQLGQSSVDVRVWRCNDTVLLDTPRTDGDVRVLIV